MQAIDLIPGAENENETAFCPDKMAVAGVDAVSLSNALTERLGPFASLLADSRGFGVLVRGGEASVVGIADAKYQEALTPSCETKADYMGEFRIDFPMLDENGEEYIQPVNVPWITIKEIMAAIRAHAENSARTNAPENAPL